MDEFWKDIPGYEGLYQISSKGRVKRILYRNQYAALILPHIMKVHPNDRGYLRVTLTKDSKRTQFRVHRLVAQCFIPNPEELPEVNHIDMDKSNNSVENLEWCTRDYNMKHWSNNRKKRRI